MHRPVLIRDTYNNCELLVAQDVLCACQLPAMSKIQKIKNKNKKIL